MEFNNKSKAFIVLMILIISIVSVGAAFAADTNLDDGSLTETSDAVAVEDSIDIETTSPPDDEVLCDAEYDNPSDELGQDSVDAFVTETNNPWTIGDDGYDTLEAAVAAANSSADSEIEIVGTPGTYDLNSKIATNAGKTITIKSSSETEAVVIKPTITVTAITIAKSSTLSLHNIVFTDFKGQLFSNSGNLTIDNCTIMNGYKTSTGVILTQSSNGNGTINNTKIINNTANTLIVNSVNSNLTINNSVFDKNYLSGTSAYPINNNMAKLILENTVFSNGNGTAAGAVYSQGASSLTVNNCQFENLTARNATATAVGVGAINTAAAANVTIDGCTFKNVTGTNGTLYLKSTNKELSGNTFEDCTILYNITGDTENDLTVGQGTQISLVLVDPATYGDSTISEPTFNVFVKYGEGEFESIAESTGTSYTFIPENIGTCSVYFIIKDIQTNILTYNVIAPAPKPWTIGSTGYDTLEEAVAAANSSADSEIVIVGEPGTYDLANKIAIAKGKVITIKSSSETEAVVIKPTTTVAAITINKGSTLLVHNIVFTDFISQLFSNSGNLTVDNCTIMNGNKSTTGVVLSQNGGNGTINNTKIINVTASVLIQNMVNGNLTINNSVFDKNYLTGASAYPINNNMAKLILENTVFSNGNGTAAGAVYSQGASSLTVNNCQFENLTARNATATAVGVGAINTAAAANVTIDGCTFKNVTGTNGTLYLKSTNKELSGNTFEDCTILYNITSTESDIYIGKGTQISLVLADPASYGDSTISEPTFNVFVKYGEGEYENIAEATETSYTFTPENIGTCSVYLVIKDIQTNTLTFNVLKADVSFTVDPNATEIKNGENVKITLTGLPEDADYSAITVTDNNKAIDVEIVDGAFIYTPKTSGKHNLTISFAGDGKYNAFEAETTISLNSEGTIIIEPGDNPSEAINNAIANAKAGDTINLGDNNVYDNLSNIKLKDGVTIVGGENTVVKAAEGASSIFIADADAKSITVKNLVFEAVENGTSLLAITPKSLSGGISQVPAIDISQITVNVADNVNPETISILYLKTADAFKPSNDVSVSNNTFSGGVKPVKTNKASYSGNVKIPKAVQTALTGANSQKVYAIPYTKAKSGKYYTITLKDANGKVLSGKTIKFTLAGKTYNVKTDAKGKAKVAINIYKAGTYTLTATFAGESTLGSSAKKVSVKILKNKVKITRKTKKVKRSSKKRTIKFTLKTTTGKKIGIKGVKLTLKINKKTYKAKTNKKGLAKFKVKLPKVKKTYKVRVKFAGNKANYKKTLKTKVKVY